METRAESNTHHLDALANEITTRKGDLGRVRQFAEQGQYAAKGPNAVQGASKMRAYRDMSNELQRRNKTTESLLVSPREPRTGNGIGDSSSGAISGSGTDALHRVTLVNRTLHEKLKVLQEENERYRCDMENMDSAINGISSDSMHTDQEVAQLADDLQHERACHEAARKGLENKTKQLEEQAETLAALEQESAAIHRQNYELSVRMEEMNREAEEREREAEKRESARTDEDGGGGEGGDGGVTDAAMKEELEKIKTVLELKTRQLEAVQSRASKTARTLELYQGRARGSGMKAFLWNVWVLLRTVGYLAFFLFVYVAVSEDALRSRGVDVYRMAH